MTATLFLIRARTDQHVVGQALLCPEVRYASVHWSGNERLDRRFADLSQWRAIEQELQLKLPATPLPTTSPIVDRLLGERRFDCALQYLVQEPLADDASPAAVVTLLDWRLRQVAV